jgi:hypothetical protein
MAYPSDLVRTKDWGAEILYSSHLEGQFDLIIDWLMAFANSTTGHKHDATDNEGPKILTANIDDAVGTQGDVIISTGAALSRVAAGTKGQALTTGGAAADATFEGMTTQGDIEYHNGTTRTRLAPGTAGDVLISGGAAANPSWLTIEDMIIKGWITLDGTGVINADDSYNVSGIVDNGAGDYTITWNTDFANTNYCVATCESEYAANNAAIKATIHTLAVGSARIEGRSTASGAEATRFDLAKVCLIAIGDQ